MAYKLNKTDGTLLTELVDGQIDTTSSDITLIGRNYVGFGEAFNENLIKILENFANCPVTNSFDVDGFKINLRPLSYRENTDFSMQNFALERQVLAINNNSDLKREDKETQLQEVFKQSSKSITH